MITVLLIIVFGFPAFFLGADSAGYLSMTYAQINKIRERYGSKGLRVVETWQAERAKQKDSDIEDQLY